MPNDVSHAINLHDVKIDAVAFKEGDIYIAQGLQYDISAQAATLGELFKKFTLAVVANMAISIDLGRNPLEGIPAAPQKFWEMFEETHVTVDVTPEPASIRTPSIMSAVRPRMKLMEAHP
jgi:hypothetical protein